MDEIKLYDRNSSWLATISGTSVSVSIDSNGLPTYNNEIVSRIEALFDASLLTVNITGTGLTMNNIRATANGDDVSSVIYWTYDSVGNINAVKYTTPDSTGEEMTWKTGVSVPPIRLTVKIKRR